MGWRPRTRAGVIPHKQPEDHKLFFQVMSSPMSVSIKTIRDRGRWAWRVVGGFGELVVKSRVPCRTQSLAIQAAREALDDQPDGLYALRTVKRGGKGE